MAIFAAFIRGSAFQAMKIATCDTDLTHDQWHLLRRFLPAAKNAAAHAPPCARSSTPFSIWSKPVPNGGSCPKTFRRGRRSIIISASGPATACWPGSTTASVPRCGSPSANASNPPPPARPCAPQVGYDAAKKTKGRKRFLLVDPLGLLLGVTLEPADCPERKGARTLLAGALADYPELLKLWVVERTFGWLMHCRRLVRDHEQTTDSAAGWIYLAMTRLMLCRLA